MVLKVNFRLLVFMALAVMFCTVSGCYTTPVRHLASDVSLLKIGESTSEDVLVFLGPPDEKRDKPGGVEKWLYRDKELSFLQKTPFLGKHLGPPLYRKVVVTITKNVVSDVVYTSSDKDEPNWADDFSWQEKKE